MKRITMLGSLLLTACGPTIPTPSTPPAQSHVEPTRIIDHDGGLVCGELRAARGDIASVCQRDERPSSVVRVSAPPIRASRWRVLSALLDPTQFGELPRPMPPGFEAPPVPHSVAKPAANGSPFVDHYTLFWGLLKASTVRITVSEQSIEVVQLWRIDNMWSERDIRDGYPNASAELLAAHVGTPIVPDGVQTIVTFSLRTNGEMTTIEMVQTGAPAFNKPIFAKHWLGLYFLPLKAGLEEPH